MPDKRYIVFSVFSVMLFLLVFSGCSTKKNTWSRRAYHSVTCHYNVYWNGEQSLKEAEQVLKESAKDNYNEILRVYNYGTKKTAQGLYPKLDRTIKKASIGIQKHSMFFGGEEKIKWVRYSYFMMGKAHFYKHDYISARRVFDYVAKQYEDDPIHYNGYLWLAKTFIETENYAKAEAALNFLQSRYDEKGFPYDVKRNLQMVSADLYIAMENYDMAYGFLERGIEMGNKRDVVTRAYFILGQINQMEGNLTLASSFFKKVIKMNPDYIMDFEARINLARSYDEGTGDSKNINKVLLKMAKNFQYNEFRDQIYYALAEVALKDHDIDKAIEYLKLSVSTSKSDDYQKTTSSLTLADIYFDRGNYPGAQAYYDTAASALPEDYPNFKAIKNKASVLSELVTYAQTIQTQDSLQRLAGMDSTELYAVIDRIIEEYKTEKAKREREAEEMSAEGGGVEFVDIGGGRPGQTLGGKWYFYNPQAISMGRSAFIQKWGNRKLEDYWFITDKRGLLTGSQETPEEGGEVAANDSVQGGGQHPSDPETRAFYLIDIPSTPEAIQASDSMLVEAYKKLGFLYLEELNDTANALKTYLEFQSRFPNNKYRLESWYALYKIYTDQQNTGKAGYYKDLIVSNYPDSDYAHVILDPDYYTKLNQAKNESAQLYERTYKAFEREQYYRVITYANRALDQFPDDTTLIPKFLYLRAISIGKVDVPDSLYAALDHLIVKYPKSEVTPMAQSVLRMLQLEYGLGLTEDQKKALEEGASEEEASPFTFAPRKMHLFLLIINSADVKINPLKVRLSDFKKKYFRLKRLNVKSLMLDNQRTLITIGNFKDKAEADDFYMALKNDKYVLSGLSPSDYQMFTISMNNYPIFYREKDVKLYEAFFNKYYTNFEE